MTWSAPDYGNLGRRHGNECFDSRIEGPRHLLSHMSGQSENFALAEPRLDQVLSKFSVCPQLHSWGTAVSCKCDFQKTCVVFSCKWYMVIAASKTSCCLCRAAWGSHCSLMVLTNNCHSYMICKYLLKLAQLLAGGLPATECSVWNSVALK